MSSNNNNWITDVVGDFIHSPIWAAPINTFIEANCASFDYDDDDDVKEGNNAASLPTTSVEEQGHIHESYQRLVDALIDGLGKDLSLDEKELRKVCQLPTNIDDSVIIDESFEQLYAARDFELFQEMMRRKNLILQLQALVSLQLQWGLLKHSDTGDDLILSLLLQATSSSSRRGSVNPPSEPIEKHQLQEKDNRSHQNDENDDDDDDDVIVVQRPQPPPPTSHKPKERREPKKTPKEEYHLPGLRRQGGAGIDTDWYRQLQQNTSKRDSDDDSIENDQSNNKSTPQTIGAIPEDLLREKLRELTVRTTSAVDDETAAAIKSRKNFLQAQRDLIVQKQRAERARDLEQQTQKQEQQQQQTRHARPQSAALVARKAMATTNQTNENKQEEQTQISDDELIRRRAMAAKLKREVVDKR